MNPGYTPAAPSNPNDPNDPNNLIAKQFGAQRQNLLYQNKAAQDQSNMAVDRQAAISGLNGGSALKAKENAQRGLNDQYQQASNQLTGQEAQAKGQESQYSRNLAEQQKQFSAQYGLQNQQFEESKNQFAQQMGLQNREFTENQKTNLVNTYLALDKAGLLINTAELGNKIGISSPSNRFTNPGGVLQWA